MKVLKSIEDVEVYQCDIDTLRPHMWINDHVIHFHGRMLEKSTQSPKILFIPPCSGQYIRFIPNPNDYFEKLHPQNYSIVFIPITNGTSLTCVGCHWSLLVWYPHGRDISLMDSNNTELKGEFSILDSLGPNIQLAQSVANKFALFYNFTIHISKMNVPYQTNGYDCGVYLMAFEEYLANHNGNIDEIHSLITPDYITSLRSRILQDILQYE